MKQKTEKSTLVRLVDDDLDLLEGLTYMLEEEGWKVRTYPNAESFLELDDKNTPGCIVLDYIMPRVTGVELQQILEKRGFKQPVLFLTAHADLDMAISVFRKGAENLLKKPVDPDELLEAIRKAVERDRRQRGEVKKSAGRYAALSEREREVIRLVNEGLMNNQIAERLGLSERTVESHRFHAYQKIGISTAKELRRFLEKAN
ncbi:response regulator [uncultured Parasutterella sp.]|uniref:response regulator transcription factor n=1 Tax=uncultured Parasutterella sp. TaxID=1263098 RepID=UPI00258F0DAD|nr:response regulator [uncultured Parasutterella sp.]